MNSSTMRRSLVALGLIAVFAVGGAGSATAVKKSALKVPKKLAKTALNQGSPTNPQGVRGQLGSPTELPSIGLPSLEGGSGAVTCVLSVFGSGGGLPQPTQEALQNPQLGEAIQRCVGGLQAAAAAN